MLALDGQTGETRHHVNLKGAPYDPVTLLLDPQMDTLYTGTFLFLPFFLFLHFIIFRIFSIFFFLIFSFVFIVINNV